MAATLVVDEEAHWLPQVAALSRSGVDSSFAHTQPNQER
jgi:hypothetical protein